LSKLLGERLDAKAYERREASVADSARQLPRDEAGVMVLLGIRAIAISVLEIHAIVLDRLATKLVGEPRVEPLERRVTGDAERVTERLCIWRELVECPQRDGAELWRGVGGEELRAAVDSVNGLSSFVLAGMRAGEAEVRFAQGCLGVGEGGIVEGAANRTRCRARHALYT
jgi:hypothetical protein